MLSTMDDLMHSTLGPEYKSKSDATSRNDLKKIAALLRHNSYTVQFKFLKCTISGF